METLRALAIVGSAAALGGEAILADAATAAPAPTPMEHVLTQAEQSRYQSPSVLEIGGQTVRMSMSSDAEASTASVNPWTHYGGDPLFPGGVHSPVQFAKELLSPLGQEAMRDDGLSNAEIKAVDAATHAGKERLVHRPFGTIEKEMTFGIDQVITEPDAQFLDSRFPNGFNAYSVTGEVDTHKTFKEKVHGKLATVKETLKDKVTIDLPTVCANIALFRRTHSISKKIHTVAKHPKTGKVFITKDAKDANGVELPHFPTGDFRFITTCKDGNGNVTVKSLLMASKQFVANCNIGSLVHVKELLPKKDPSDWLFITPVDQTKTVEPGNNLVGFVDKEKGTPPPPPVTCQPPEKVINGVCEIPPKPPVIVGYNKPPGLEQLMQGTSYEVYFQADGPNNDNLQVTAEMSDPNCATTGPVQEQGNTDLYGVLVSASAANSCVGDDEQITAEAFDPNTGLSDSVTEDLGDIIAQPSFGSTH